MYTLPHLIISEYVSKSIKIENFPQYYLGTISPDAIHNRKDFNPDMKKDSHLCVGSEKWGMIINNDEWKENVIIFLNKHKKTEDKDFILGYCSHILADMYNNIYFWTPFKQKNPEVLKNLYNYDDLHHRAGYKMEIELALTYNNRNEFWVNLEKSKGINLSNIIYADEIEKQKINILNIWYKDKARSNLSTEEMANTMDTIKKASDYIIEFFNENL